VDHNLKIVLSNLKNINMQGGEMVTERQLGDVHFKIIESNSSVEVENALIQLEQLYL